MAPKQAKNNEEGGYPTLEGELFVEIFIKTLEKIANDMKIYTRVKTPNDAVMELLEWKFSEKDSQKLPKWQPVKDDEKWKEIKLWIATLAVKHNDVIKENQKLIPELYQPAHLTEKVKFSHHIMGVVAVAFYSLTPLKVDKNSEMWKDARTMSYFFQKLFRKSAKTKKAKVLDVLIHATAWYLGVADKKFTNKTSQEKIDKYNADVQAYGIALHEPDQKKGEKTAAGKVKVNASQKGTEPGTSAQHAAQEAKKQAVDARPAITPARPKQAGHKAKGGASLEATPDGKQQSLADKLNAACANMKQTQQATIQALDAMASHFAALHTFASVATLALLGDQADEVTPGDSRQRTIKGSLNKFGNTMAIKETVRAELLSIGVVKPGSDGTLVPAFDVSGLSWSPSDSDEKEDGGSRDAKTGESNKEEEEEEDHETNKEDFPQDLWVRQEQDVQSGSQELVEGEGEDAEEVVDIGDGDSEDNDDDEEDGQDNAKAASQKPFTLARVTRSEGVARVKGRSTPAAVTSSDARVAISEARRPADAVDATAIVAQQDADEQHSDPGGGAGAAEEVEPEEVEPEAVDVEGLKRQLQLLQEKLQRQEEKKRTAPADSAPPAHDRDSKKQRRSGSASGAALE